MQDGNEHNDNINDWREAETQIIKKDFDRKLEIDLSVANAILEAQVCFRCCATDSFSPLPNGHSFCSGRDLKLVGACVIQAIKLVHVKDMVKRSKREAEEVLKLLHPAEVEL